MEVAIKRRIPKEYLGAFKEGHRGHSKALIDHDYTDDLLRRAVLGDEKAKEALEFLTKHNNEFYKGVFKEDEANLLANTQEEKQEHWNYLYEVKTDVMTWIPEEIDKIFLSHTVDIEDGLIEVIDLIREKKKAKHQ